MNHPLEQTAPLHTRTASLPDSRIIQQVLQGEINAFELIMRRYNQRLFRIARSIVRNDADAMEVVQDSYVKAFHELEQFKGPHGFSSWLSRIVHNEALMRLRRSRLILLNLDSPMNDFPEPPSSEPRPQEWVANGQLRQLLEQAIDRLNLDERCVYMMRAVQQLSTEETARSLDISTDAVKTRFKRARQKLQQRLQKHLDEAGLSVHEFAGYRCDAIVSNVIKRIGKP